MIPLGSPHQEGSVPEMSWELGSVHDPSGIPTPGGVSRLLPPSAGQGPEERGQEDAQGLSLMFQAGAKGAFAML